jgi:hypothetical protein
MDKIYKSLNNKNNFIRITGYIFVVLLFFYYGCDRLVDTSQTDNGIPPAVPVGLQVAYATDGEVVLAWQSNSEADLAGYNIYRSRDSTNFILIGNSGYNYYYDDSLQYNKTYYYRITAIDIWNNESLPTKVVSAKPINRYVPSAPIGLSINARNYQGSLSVYLTWNPNYESDIAGYNIYRSLKQEFNADSTSLVGFSTDINYTDTLKLSLYTTYYYKLRAVDKGGLIGIASNQVSDEILGVSQIIFPANNSEVNYFSSFLIKAIGVPANYKIVVQDNMFYGEVWSHNFFSSTVNDTLAVNFNPTYINTNVPYYLRIITFSNGANQPNSVSPLYKFIIKQ